MLYTAALNTDPNSCPPEVKPRPMKTIYSSSYVATKGLCSPEMQLSQCHYDQTYQQDIVSRRRRKRRGGGGGGGGGGEEGKEEEEEEEEEEALSGCFAEGLLFLVSGVVRNISVVTADSTVSSQELENKPFAGTQS